VLVAEMEQMKVAPHVGAWIETQQRVLIRAGANGRAPRGRVD